MFIFPSLSTFHNFTSFSIEYFGANNHFFAHLPKLLETLLEEQADCAFKGHFKRIRFLKRIRTVYIYKQKKNMAI